MINKRQNEVRVRRLNHVLKRIEPPLIDHLLQWTIKKPRHNPTAIRLVMLGQSEADAKMYMVVFCKQRVRRRAKKFFSSSLTLELCKPQGAPEHAVEVLVVDPPIPVARAVAQLAANYIYGPEREEGFCGAPMWFFDHETSAARQVTLGGILQVTRDRGPELFGMIVGYAIEELENPKSPATEEDEKQVDSDSDMASESGAHRSDDPAAAPNTPSGDLIPQ